MEHLKKLKEIKIYEWLFYTLIFSLFFPIRKVLDFGTSNLLGQYSDFTSISIYLSDLVMLSILIIGIITKNLSFRILKTSLLLIFLLFIRFILNFDIKSPLFYFDFFKSLELIILFEITYQYFLKYARPRGLLLNFAFILAFFQVFLEIFQFLFKKSLGLFYFGESHLTTSIYGVAKIVAHGTTYLRGYGSFPHPNLLSAFLIFIILAYISQYYIKTHESYKPIAIRFFGLFFLIFGLFITFSRASLLAFGVGLSFLAILLVFTKVPSKTLKNIFISIVGSVVISISLLWPIFSSRLTLADNAVKERGFYNHIAIKIIRANPLKGLGFNQTLLHMQQYSPVKLEPWEIQPIHNYYLAITSDLGIPIAIAFISIYFYLFFTLLKKAWLSRNNFDFVYIYRVTLLSILLSIFVLMFFDHYFYTLQQTQFLFWLILGLVAAEIKKPLLI